VRRIRRGRVIMSIIRPARRRRRRPCGTLTFDDGTAGAAARDYGQSATVSFDIDRRSINIGWLLDAVDRFMERFFSSRKRDEQEVRSPAVSLHQGSSQGELIAEKRTCVCVCVYVCERERKRGREGAATSGTAKYADGRINIEATICYYYRVRSASHGPGGYF